MMKYYCAPITAFQREEDFEAALEKVQNLRKEKVMRCKKEEDKKRSLAAGCLLRFGLMAEGLDYDSLDFTVLQGGKLVLGQENAPYFSISHAADYAACVLSDRPIGLDLEPFARLKTPKGQLRIEQMSKKCLTQEERALLEEKSGEEKEKAFLEFWTKKEAYSKCMGQGLGLDFSTIDTIALRDHFWTHCTQDGYCVSIYQEGGDFSQIEVKKLRTWLEMEGKVHV